jgi:hypothetical protein
MKPSALIAAASVAIVTGLYGCSPDSPDAPQEAMAADSTKTAQAASTVGAEKPVPVASIGRLDDFLKTYNKTAKARLPLLQTTSCRTINVRKVAGKTITECDLMLPNGMLTLDSVGGDLKSAWMLVNNVHTNHPSDLLRTGGILLCGARASCEAGDFYQLSSDAFHASHQRGWQHGCVRDTETHAPLCVSSNNDGLTFHVTLN